MSSSTLPVLVLVPGAFGTTEGFSKIIPLLEGIETHPGDYPSCEPEDPSTASCTDDITALKRILVHLLDEQKKDVVILAHSYGGIVAGGAAKDLDKDTREGQGHPNAVVGLIYVAGNITLENESLLKAIGGKYPDFINSDDLPNGLAVIKPAKDVLYNDCEPALLSELDMVTKRHALRAFETKPSAPAWKDRGFNGRRVYIRTLDDNCNPKSVQDDWIKKTEVEWQVIDLETGHMPWVKEPELFASHVVRSVEDFSKL
ncbi:Alpha/beta hydrolase fold-1 [Nemania sp. FL0031]|nr:Alpha/beta hydrolase fold-1 [Nemania sp. FL0031]